MHPVHGAAFWGVIRALLTDALGIYLYGGKERDIYEQLSIPPGLLFT
jgi:hypothetical protein